MKKIIGLAITILFSTNVSAGDPAKGQAATGVCAGCHAVDGNSVIPANPKLAGQNEKYLIKQLKDFKTQARKNDAMLSMANMLDDQAIEDVAAFYASQKVQHAAVEKKYIEVAQKLYRGGDADRDIAACIACHGAKGEGMAAAGFPAISGQQPEYTMTTLKAFRSGARDNDANEVMRDITAKMSDEQIEALAFYLAGLH